MNRRSINARRSGISNGVKAAVVVVVIVIIAGATYLGYHFGAANVSQTTVTTLQTTTVSTTVTGNQTQLASSEIAQLAYSHWASIGTENLNATMSQYSTNVTLIWAVSPTSPLNGTYKGTSAIQSTWAKFFQGNPSIYYTIYNYTSAINGNTANVSANIWYIIGNGTKTLKLPYGLTYTNESGKWVLTTEWWGFPSNPGLITNGIAVAPTSTTTITTTTTVNSTTTTTSASTNSTTTTTTT